VAAFDEFLIGPFLITRPTIVLFFEDSRHVAHTLPAGSVVKAVDGHIGDKGLIEVIWKGKNALMFAVDLKSRGEKVLD